MLTNARELEAYTYEGRRLIVPEIGSWVSFDCTECGTRTETSIRGNGLECDGCDAYALIPASWSA
jgi:hypothetical protein